MNTRASGSERCAGCADAAEPRPGATRQARLGHLDVGFGQVAVRDAQSLHEAADAAGPETQPKDTSFRQGKFQSNEPRRRHANCRSLRCAAPHQRKAKRRRKKVVLRECELSSERNTNCSTTDTRSAAGRPPRTARSSRTARSDNSGEHSKVSGSHQRHHGKAQALETDHEREEPASTAIPSFGAELRRPQRRQPTRLT